MEQDPTYPPAQNPTPVPTVDPFLLNTEPFDYKELKNEPFLANLQGNILKGHGRDNTTHIFLKFLDGKQDAAKTWIKKFTKENVTTFKEQLRQRELYNRHKVSGGVFGSIYLTASGCNYLGFSPSLFPDAEAFKNGMKTRSEILFDKQSDWDITYQGDLHAMILLADDDPLILGRKSKEVLDSIENELDDQANNISVIVEIEYGTAIRNSNKDGLEHFGYVDGISQPIFLKDELEIYKEENPHATFDPFAPLDLVLVPDPLMPNASNCFGSYFVYRKLEQDVRGFKTAEKQIAKTLGLSEEDEERAGAMIVGRFEDGTPLTLSDTDKMISSGIMNNFNYQEQFEGKDDSQGARCPFHAHIRKANPRRTGDEVHRMARRGISYGHRNVSTTIDQTFVQMPKSGVGLLFMSFQKSIENQFEFIITNWVNASGFPNGDTGIDVEIGQGSGSRSGHYPKVYNDAGTLQSVSFDNFVAVKGGEYFFAPSIKFLQQLS